MATSACLLAPFSPSMCLLGPSDVEDLMRSVGSSAFFLMGYDAAFWLDLLSHRSTTVYGCRDGGTGDLVGFVAIAKSARAGLPREQRVGPLRALVHHRKCALVRFVAVLRGYRRLGVATMLLQEASNALRVLPKPPTLLLGRVPAYNDEAVACFQAIGFSIYAELPGLVYGTDRVYTRVI